MGDTGGARQGGKPRPLGQVKTESLHFHTGSSSAAGRPSPALLTVPAFTDLRNAQGGEEGLKASIKSMRELRESLRHAALLNIVAAANNDLPPTPGQDPRPHLQGAAPSQLAPPHHQRGRVTSPLALQVTSSRGSPYPQTTEGGGRSAGSGTYHIHSPNRESGGSTPQTLVANLLSPRMRTISIPRPGPRAADLPGPFIHKSVAQAKECLSRVGEMVRSRSELEASAAAAPDRGASESAAAPISTTHDVAVMRLTGGVAGGGLQPVQGHALMDSTRNHASSAPTHGPEASTAVTTRYVSGGKTSSALSRDTTASRSSAGGPPLSASVGSESSRTTAELRSGKSRATAKSLNGEESRASSSNQQMIPVRRHLTAGKKRELVKRLTEMAKCEAVDMTDPLGSDDEGGEGGGSGGGSAVAAAPGKFMPPMIIMSQQRHDKRQQDPSSSSSIVTEPATVSQNATAEADLSRNPSNTATTIPSTTTNMYRAKSLSSLIASNNYVSNSRGKTSSSEQNSDAAPDAPRSVGNLERTVSGSLPDLADGLEASGRRQGYTLERNDSEDRLAVDSLFTDGIVGKMIRREGEAEGGGKGPLESRPLLPNTPSVRSRRGTRPSGRRSSQGLRDRGPLDSYTPSPAPGNKLTSTTTNVLSLVPSATPTTKGFKSTAEAPAGTLPPEYIPSYSQTLPTLTITGLHRERTLVEGGASHSRAARELRPANRNSMSSSMQLFQQLDDQCEKLQRQLNISLNVPSRRSHSLQQGTPPATPMNRSDVSAHLQCLPLGDGGGRETGTTTPSSSSSSSFRRRGQYLRGNTVGPALSDVDEHSHVGTVGGGGMTDRTLVSDWSHSQGRQVNGLGRSHSHRTSDADARYDLSAVPVPDTAEVEASRRMLLLSSADDDVPSRRVAGAPPLPTAFSGPESASASEPALKAKSVKEPRYQGFSSRVPEGEARSQFHYVHPSHEAESEEAREMKYRVLKALDQDVYYDFQHRKYRNSPAAAAPTAASASRCSKEEDRPRVHFYKVKVDGSHE